MYMTDTEIISNFNNRKNPLKEQVKVLAELNCVPVKEMAEKIKSLGLDVDIRCFTSGDNSHKNTKTKAKAETPEAHANAPEKDEITRLTDEIERKEEVIRALNDMLTIANNHITVLQERLKHMDMCKDVARTMAAMVGRMMEG